MSERMTLARPYAEAAFALAREKGALDAWQKMLATSASIAADARVAALSSDPRVTRQRLEGLFVELLGPALSKEGANFIRLLIANQRIVLLPEIAGLFDALKAEAEGSVEAEAISAYPLDAAQTQQIAAGLKQRLKREVNVISKVDPSLIGGVVIRAGDLVIDGSVTGRLRALSSHLNR